MIRKSVISFLVIVLFLYSAWNFYAQAVAYDPLAEVSVRKFRQQDSEKTLLSDFKSAWNSDIYEKNLFSPIRTYKEPKPAVAVVAPPVVEPPKRPEMVLKGIVLDTFGEYVAYLEINKSKTSPVRKGDKVEDIELIDITNRDVVLKWNNETIRLSIDKIKTISNPRTNK